MGTAASAMGMVTEPAGDDAPAVPPVSVGLLVHAPFLAGYHAEQLDVIRLSVLTARVHAGRPVHLMVVDNGSCAEVRSWLIEALADGRIDQLVLNRENIGKVSAVHQIVLGAPGPDVVYADGDLRYLPGWLDAMVEARDAFPEAGVIGGAPPMADTAHGVTIAALAAEPGSDLVVERGVPLAAGFIDEALDDVGVRGEVRERRAAELRALHGVRYRRGDQVVFDGASHCQYLVTATVRAGLVPRLGGAALSAEDDATFDADLARAGGVRVSLPTAVYRHVGNRLSDDDRSELVALGAAPTTHASAPLHHRLYGRYPVRLAARWAQDQSYRVLLGLSPTIRGWTR